MKIVFIFIFSYLTFIPLGTYAHALPYKGLSRSFCTAYIEKLDALAPASVSSTFDQDGQPVAPADLPATAQTSDPLDEAGAPLTPADLQDAPPLKPRETLSFPVYFDLEKYKTSNGSDNAGTSSTPRPPVFFDKMALGRITINPDGKLSFEGQSLTSDDEQLFEKDCRQLLARHTP